MLWELPILQNSLTCFQMMINSRKISVMQKKNLLQDLRIGSKIPHDRWPSDYRNLKMTNLWVYRLDIESRLVYSILSDTNGFIGLMIEAFRTHKEYEKRFGY